MWFLFAILGIAVSVCLIAVALCVTDESGGDDIY